MDARGGAMQCLVAGGAHDDERVGKKKARRRGEGGTRGKMGKGTRAGFLYCNIYYGILVVIA